MREWIRRSWAKFVGASLAGANFAQMLEAENSSRMAVGEIDLDGIVADRRSGASRNFRLVHWEHSRRQSAGKLAWRWSAWQVGFLGTLVVT